MGIIKFAKKLIFVLIILGILVFFSYSYLFPSESVVEELPVNEEIVTDDTLEPVIEEPTSEPEDDLSCKVTQDCAGNLRCINNVCTTVAELYETEGCEQTCNFNQVVVETDKGDSYTLSRGSGSYTAAGAIEWKLVSGPDYCNGDEVIVPIQLIKKQTGEVISKEMLTLNPGETSDVITHPNIASVSFTMTVKSVNEECS